MALRDYIHYEEKDLEKAYVAYVEDLSHIFPDYTENDFPSIHEFRRMYEEELMSALLEDAKDYIDPDFFKPEKSDDL